MHLNCTTPQRPLSQPLATLIDSHYQHLVLGHRCPILLSSVLMFQNIIHVRITTFYKSGQSASTHLVLHILRSVSESIFIVYVSTFTRKLFATSYQFTLNMNCTPLYLLATSPGEEHKSRTKGGEGTGNTSGPTNTLTDYMRD